MDQHELDGVRGNDCEHYHGRIVRKATKTRMKNAKRLTILVALGFLACQKPAWKEFSSQAGGFSILLPGTPVEQVSTVNTAAGPFDFHLFSLDTFGEKGIAYTVAYSDYPESIFKASTPETILNSARDGVLSKMQGELIRDQATAIDGHTGKELSIRSDDGEFVIQARMFMVERRLYQIIVEAVKERAASRDVARCFESFKLL